MFVTAVFELFAMSGKMLTVFENSLSTSRQASG
jgi:hypothetical protein